MRSVYIASTEGSGGKTTLAVGLCLALRARGLNVGYFKPVGAVQAATAGSPVDEDVRFVAGLLALPDAPADLCPVMLNEDALRAVVSGPGAEPMKQIATAYGRVAEGRDAVVCEGLGEIWQGRFLRVSGADVVGRLDLRTLLVAKFAGIRQLDDISYVHDVLKARLLGVVFNMVPDTRLEAVEHHYAAFLADDGIANYGIIPSDRRLSAVAVDGIARALGGEFLCCADQADRLAENYMIGAMSPEHALGYFERSPNKVVVVGGDRDDLILVALQTGTVALVLTGGYAPGEQVLATARSAGVPLISVSGDTLSAAEGLRRLFSRAHVHEPGKADLIARVVEQCVAIDRLVADLT